MSTILDINDLSVDVTLDKQNHNVVNGLNLSIKKKQKYGIVGESGSGKSLTSLSILNLLPDVLSISNGSIILDESTDLTKLSKKEMLNIRGNEISIIFQEPMTALDPLFTVEHQISEVLRFHGKYTKKQMQDMIIDMLEKVGFAEPKQLLKRYPHQLSGGMRQRVMIAMALICKPKLLIADEPTTALDVTIQAQILDLMNDLTQDYDTSILMITHDLGVIAETCERVAVMYAGTLVEESTVEQLFDNPTHPYSVGLLESVQSLGDKTKKLYSIPGNVPAPAELKESGCRFASRCPHVMDICRQQDPPLFQIDDDHTSRCWLYQEGGEKSNEYRSSNVEG
ncbi:ABC transporter ATP-binding protein [Virgibacillus salinus]|uniref:Peptide/nickel transport system ATP-binding protein n=1 Tax=Virgibacillus salinus TaxID=553311 RepID=A0A1H0Z8V2_9BACI|nr:ABC transporter ATP-binding protein [Virgibacillus salinus]SDQ23546.1 peptide/nickel transport system ATP-binding protein [Virgibacillus salinus]